MAPIHAAARNGNLNQVKALLNQGVPVNSRDDYYGWTPLHWAARTGHLNVVQELLKRGAHVNPRDITGFTPLMAASLSEQRPNIIHALIKAGANPKYRTKHKHGSNIFSYLQRHNNSTKNAARTSRAASKWQNTTRKRKAERMLLSPRLLGSTPLNENAIRSISRYLTVKKKNNNK